jgi:hypothetical protein
MGIANGGACGEWWLRVVALAGALARALTPLSSKTADLSTLQANSVVRSSSGRRSTIEACRRDLRARSVGPGPTLGALDEPPLVAR